MAIKTTVIQNPETGTKMVMAADVETARLVDALGYAARQYRQSLGHVRSKANRAMEDLDQGTVGTEFDAHPGSAYALTSILVERGILTAKVDEAHRAGVSVSTVDFILKSTDWFKVEVAPQGTATV